MVIDRPPACKITEVKDGKLKSHLEWPKANSDVCHTAAILDAAHGNVQQPAHNLVTVLTCRSQSHFLPSLVPRLLFAEWEISLVNCLYRFGSNILKPP